MTIKEARKLDSILLAIVSMAGGIAFGIWFRSLAAGFFAWIALGMFGNIGWSIEYRGMGYDAERKPLPTPSKKGE